MAPDRPGQTVGCGVTRLAQSAKLDDQHVRLRPNMVVNDDFITLLEENPSRGLRRGGRAELGVNLARGTLGVRAVEKSGDRLLKS